MTTNNTEKLIPRYALERCKNCSGYGAIGTNPRISCPTCSGRGSNEIPLVPKEEEDK